MKKLIISLLSAALITINICPTQAHNTKNDIEIIYENNYISKYIYEVEKEYTIILDRVNEYYIVDDNIYTFNSYINAYSINPDDPLSVLLEENPLMINNIDYDAEYLRYENYESQTHPCNTDTNEISTFCISCGIGTTVPKNNYKNTGYIIQIKELGDVEALVFSQTPTFAQLIALKLGIELAKATVITSSLVAAGFIAGMYIVGGKTVKQYLHNICPKAVKEEELIEIESTDGQKAYTTVNTRYFFSSSPY